MRKILIASVLLVLGLISASAQDLSEMNFQVHGYATQSFLYTTQNNVFSTDSSNGSPAWDEAVVNISTQPMEKLRVGVQARYFILGNFGNEITLDWAAADYKVNDKFGVRFGKVKTPMGLWNETQDIDPSYMWSLLPQGVYGILSRNSFLAHLGGVAYGTVKLGKSNAKMDWRLFGGQINESPNDPNITLGQQASGIALPNGWTGPMWGATVQFHPTPSWTIGASDQVFVTNWKVVATAGPLKGANGTPPSQNYYYFARYEKKKVMVAGEYFRQPYTYWYKFPDAPSLDSTGRVDQRSWYAMASYKVTDKLSVGAYHYQSFDHAQALGDGRYSKDWVASGRYDINQYLYAKAEQHFIKGNYLDYDTDHNQNGLKPSTKLTVLKIGVSF